MEKTRNFVQKIKSLSKRRKIFFSLILVFVVFAVFKNFILPNGDDSLLFEKIESKVFVQSVVASGQVVSDTDLNLSFNSGGIVKSINVKVGDKVYKGKVLASLNQGPLSASLTQARGSLLAAQAKYEKIIEGSTDKEVALAKVLLDNAKNDYIKIQKVQEELVKKAYDDLSYFQKTGYSIDEISKINAYNQALANQSQALSQSQSLINQRQAEFDLKIDTASDADISLARADILSAQGQVELANANLENSIIRSPAQGTITSVDIKIGELAEAYKKAIVLEDLQNLYIEAKINEANISILKIGDPVDVTYDALGKDKVFVGEVFSIDPSATADDGIINYKIKVLLKEKNNIIKPGMNADITITTFKKENAIAVPFSAISNKDGMSYVKVVKDENQKDYEEVSVETGVVGDGNLIEIISGLNGGEMIMISNKK